VLAPFERHGARWVVLPWVFADTGEPLVPGIADSDGLCWEAQTLKDVLRAYANHWPRDKLPGRVSLSRTMNAGVRGVLNPRPVKAAARRWLTLKESTWAGDPRNTTNAVGWVPTPAFVRGRRAGPWPPEAIAAIRIVGTRILGRRLGVPPGTVHGWVTGASPADPRRVLAAILDALDDIGFVLPGDQEKSPAATCAMAPQRVEILRRFLAVVLAREPIPELASAIGRPRRTLYLWREEIGRGPSASGTTIGQLNLIAGLLARHHLHELRRSEHWRLARGPLGDRQILCGWLAGWGDLAVPEPADVFNRMAEFVRLGNLASLAEAAG
jgi:hypothetical protein